MIRKAILISALAALALASTAFADDDDRKHRRMVDALPLSIIIQIVEQQRPVAYFKEIERDDDDDNEWKIEYVDPRGRKIKISVDVVSGHIKKG